MLEGEAAESAGDSCQVATALAGPQPDHPVELRLAVGGERILEVGLVSEVLVDGRGTDAHRAGQPPHGQGIGALGGEQPRRGRQKLGSPVGAEARGAAGAWFG